MQKIFPELERQMSIMTKYSLTSEEYFFVYLLFLATEPNPHPQYLSKYFTECRKEFVPRETLISLQEKGVLDSKYKVPEKGENFELQKVKLSKSFLTSHFKLSFEAGEELFFAYPSFIQTPQKLLPAKNITKGGFQSLEDFFFTYAKAIKHDPATHNEVLEILQWAIDNGLIMYGIVEYVVTRKWVDHKRLRDEGGSSGFVVKVQTQEDL